MESRNHFDPVKHQQLAIYYLTDQGQWNDALKRFYESGIDSQASSYNYLFRKLVDSGKTQEAGIVSGKMLEAISSSSKSGKYLDLASVVRYYMNLLESPQK